MALAGADVGGTNVVVGLVGEDRRVLARAKQDTPRSVGELVELVAAMVDDLPERPEALGIGIPGIIHEGRVVQAPNLEGWDRSTDVAGTLADRLGMPVELVADGRADEVATVGVEALLHQEVDPAEIDIAEIERDLLAVGRPG